MKYVLVNKAGVGFPSGDIGMESIQLHSPQLRYSASAGDVNFKNSVSAPAIVMPGISLVSVYEMTSENVKRFFSSEFMKFFPFCSFP